MPAASRTARTASRLRTPAKASEPIMPGAKREALLVHPRHADDVHRRTHATPGQRGQHLQRSHHAVHAVEAPAAGLAVEMAAREHGWRVAVGARQRNEEIAGRIGRRLQPAGTCAQSIIVRHDAIFFRADSACRFTPPPGVAPMQAERHAAGPTARSASMRPGDFFGGGFGRSSSVFMIWLGSARDHAASTGSGLDLREELGERAR